MSRHYIVRLKVYLEEVRPEEDNPFGERLIEEIGGFRHVFGENETELIIDREIISEWTGRRLGEAVAEIVRLGFWQTYDKLRAA